MFQLYTYLQWNLIELAAAGNRQRHQVTAGDEEADRQKMSATNKLKVIKYSLHALIIIQFFGTATQVTMMYLKSDYASQNPMNVSL